jgi:hypothetical protein
MEVSEARKLKGLEDENRRLKKRLELAGMRKDVAFTREQFAVSERRACKLMGVDSGSYRYELRPDRKRTTSVGSGGIGQAEAKVVVRKQEWALRHPGDRSRHSCITGGGCLHKGRSFLRSRYSLSSRRVTRSREGVIERRGKPEVIRRDNVRN